MMDITKDILSVTTFKGEWLSLAPRSHETRSYIACSEKKTCGMFQTDSCLNLRRKIS